MDASPAYVAQSTSPSELTLFPNTPPLSLNAGGLCGDHEVSFEPLPKIYSRLQGQAKRPRDVERVKLDQSQMLKPAYFEQRLDRNDKRCDWFGEWIYFFCCYNSFPILPVSNSRLTNERTNEQ